MSAPLIPAFSPAPSRSDSVPVFNNKAFTLVDELNAFVNQANALGAWMNGVAGAAPEPLTVVGTSLQLAAVNKNRYLLFINENEKTLICPSSTQLVAGTQWLITNMNTGAITLDTFGGSTINNNATIAQNESAFLIKISETEYNLIKFGGSGGGGGGAQLEYVAGANEFDFLNGAESVLATCDSMVIMAIKSNNWVQGYVYLNGMASTGENDTASVYFPELIPSGFRPSTQYSVGHHSIGYWINNDSLSPTMVLDFDTNGDLGLTIVFPDNPGGGVDVFVTTSIPFGYPLPLL